MNVSCPAKWQRIFRDGARLRIVGLVGCPNCGVQTTSSGYTGGRVRECEHARVSGRGVFMEELLAELERRGVWPLKRMRSAGKQAR